MGTLDNHIPRNIHHFIHEDITLLCFATTSTHRDKNLQVSVMQVEPSPFGMKNPQSCACQMCLTCCFRWLCVSNDCD